MQAFVFNAVVSESQKTRVPQENFSIPVAVRDALAEMWDRVGVKQKGIAYVAAILAFHRMTDEEQYAAMDEVSAARRRNDFRHLLRRDVGKTGEPTTPAHEPGQSSTSAPPSVNRRRGAPKAPVRSVGRAR